MKPKEEVVEKEVRCPCCWSQPIKGNMIQDWMSKQEIGTNCRVGDLYVVPHDEYISTVPHELVPSSPSSVSKFSRRTEAISATLRFALRLGALFKTLCPPVPLDESLFIDPHESVSSFPSFTPPDESFSTNPYESVPSSPPPSQSAPPPLPLLVYYHHKALLSSIVSTPAVDPLAFDNSDLANHKYSLRIQPQSYKVACQDPHWIQAMEDELSALQKTNTWELVPLPTDENLVFLQMGLQS
ncbi:hypothetical protein CsSME_00000616 [Camellia sinensis var. sinensis]